MMQELPEMMEDEGTYESLDDVEPITMLTMQHREIEALFAEIEEAGERAAKTRERLFETLAKKLQVHTQLEEKLFYPTAEEADVEDILEAYEEHDNIKGMIRKISKTSGKDETFMPKIKTLKELVRHHVKEEEEKIFPQVRERMKEDELFALGEEMQRASDRYKAKEARDRKSQRGSRTRH